LVPFHCTTDDVVKPVPRTLMDVVGEPTTRVLGEIDVMTGVGGGTMMLSVAEGEVPPPGAGLVTVTGSVVTLA